MVLAIVVVFLLLLTMTGFSSSIMTRTDVSFVNNQMNEKKALFAAEAGVTEALLRLAMTSTTMINGFDARIDPVETNPAWTGYIVFGSCPSPLPSGVTVCTPSIQSDSNRLAYSLATPTDGALKLYWERDSPTGPIKTQNGAHILNIAATGQSGNARRTVRQQIVNAGPLSAVILSEHGCSALSAQGSGTVVFPGNVQVNSDCSTALTVGGSAGISAPSDATINIYGGYSGSNVTPTPNTGMPVLPDPLASLATPALGLVQSASRKSVNSTTTLQPGVYVGGISISGGDVTLAAGEYIMAGGGLSISANASVTGNGVMIFSTCNGYTGPSALPPVCLSGSNNGYGPLSVTSNRTTTLSAPATGTFKGIIYFQDRNSSQKLSIGGTASGSIDGVIYAAAAELEMSGGANILHSQLVVGSLTMSGGPVLYTPSAPVLTGGTGLEKIAWLDY